MILFQPDPTRLLQWVRGPDKGPVNPMPKARCVHIHKPQQP